MMGRTATKSHGTETLKDLSPNLVPVLSTIKALVHSSRVQMMMMMLTGVLALLMYTVHCPV